MNDDLSLDQYVPIVGEDVIEQLRRLAGPLSGMKVVHVNSTKEGGGVAEILHRMIPLKRELGIDASWEVVTGNSEFYECTKGFHNAIQGNMVKISRSLLDQYERTNAENAEKLRDCLENADVVFIHDPQPAPLLGYMRKRRGPWIWRCHIDVSRPYRPVWKYLRKFVVDYNASIWSLADFAQPMPHPAYLIPPSIDPLSIKNMDLPDEELDRIAEEYGLDRDRPIVTQVSRFDRFKDPLGVIEAYNLARKFLPIQLVLVGGGATDDPEGKAVFDEVEAAAKDDPDIHLLLLPPDAHRTINALQRISDIVMQKSIREGFGLTVTEAMWKGKPVIGGDTGGIRLQVINHHTGFLVNSPEGGALRIRYLLHYKDRMREMGRKARQFVLENFLLTRHLREYLTMMVALTRADSDRIEIPF